MFAGQSTLWLIAALVSLAGCSGWESGEIAGRCSGSCSFSAYTIYGAKKAAGHEFWPYTGWGAQALTFFQRPWSFWYTILYTGLMTIFGIQAMKRWGFDRKDKFQIWRYVSLLSFQWVFFFLIPEFLFRWAVEYQWIGERLAADPNFAQNAWRSYGLVYAWPLFFYTFFGSPNQVWIVWGVLLSFVLIPMLVLFHGKRYCSWICGCGGLAETLGDRWRHLTPERARIDQVGADEHPRPCRPRSAITVLVLAGSAAGAQGLTWYNLIADTWLVGILPVTLYPFFGGKDLVPVLVSAGEDDGDLQQSVHADESQPLRDSFERPLHRVRRVLPLLPGRDRRDAIRAEAGNVSITRTPLASAAVSV